MFEGMRLGVYGEFRRSQLKDGGALNVKGLRSSKSMRAGVSAKSRMNMISRNDSNEHRTFPRRYTR